MFRRLLTVAALVATGLSLAPSIASAEPSGGTNADATVMTAMGKIAGGGQTNCAIINVDQVACWGENNKGQVGDGTTTDRNRATTIDGLHATQVAVSNGTITSSMSACALLTDTSVKCWGYNAYGGLGDGTQTDSATPVSVCAVEGCGTGNLTGAKAVSVGFGFACAILADDSVACWGYNNQYQLGFNYMTDPQNRYLSTVPVPISGVTDAVQISLGSGHACAVISGGDVKCWGQGGNGQLGLGDGNNYSHAANTVTAPEISGVKAIAAMYTATCAIVADDSVRCWGSNFNLDSTQTDSIHNSPVKMQIGATTFYAKALDAGTYGACAVKTDNQLVCWGSLGQKSGGPTYANMQSINIAADVPGMTGVSGVAVGTNSVCVTQSTIISCWGSSTKPVLGNGVDQPDSAATAAVLTVPTNQTASVTPVSDRTTASGPVTLAGTSSSGVALEYSSNTKTVCKTANISSTWVITLIGPGTCSITGTAPAGIVDSTYYSSASETITFSVTAVAPTVSLNEATSITISSATVSASVNPAQLTATSVLKYSTSASLDGATTVALPSISPSDTATVLSSDLSGLASGTTYYYTVVSTNSVGTTTATIRSFSTLGYAPVVTTGSPTSVSSGRATLNAVVTPGGVTTSIWFTIGQKSDLSDGTRIEYRDLSDLTPVDVSVTASNLTESTRYYYRVEASNLKGSVKGDTKSFTAARPVGITINNAAEFTNKKQVTIFATGPSGSTQVIISNDGGFGSAQTFSLSDSYAEIPWTLVASRDERLPKTVYARFVQRFGTQSSTNTDDIILDTTAPVMTSASGASTSPGSDNVSVQGVRISASKGGVKLTVRAKDANSGIGTVQVKGSSGGSPVDVATGSPKASSRTIKVNTTKKKLWVRVVDRAGNVSKWVTVTVK